MALHDTEKARIEKQIEVMQAYRDGKQIQSKQGHGDEWADVTTPSWNFNGTQYRIKPMTAACIVVFTESGVPAEVYPDSQQLEAGTHALRISGFTHRFSCAIPDKADRLFGKDPADAGRAGS